MIHFKIKILYIIQWVTKITFNIFFRKDKIKYNSYNSIIILCGAGIGDAVMATPIIEIIKLNNKKIRLTIICNSANAEIFKYNPFISKQITYNRTFLSLIKAYYTVICNKFDIFIGSQPSNTVIHSLFAFFSFAKIKAKINKDNSYKYLNYNFLYDILVPNDMNRHRVQLNLEIINSIGLSPNLPNIDKCKIYTTGLHINNRIYSNSNYIIIHLGSGEKNKLWPVENFSKIINYIIKINKYVIIVGGIKEKNLLCKMQNNNDQKIINLIGKLTLIELFLLLQNSSLLITNDTGVMHIAATTNIKILALFGSTNPAHIGPYTSNSMIIKQNSINDISVREVINSINKCLNE